MTLPVRRSTAAGQPSRSFPLGISDADGPANVAVYAPGVEELALHFQPPGQQWQSTLLTDYTDGVHHGLVPGLVPGSRYGFRDTGRTDVRAMVSNECQLLLDPYGRAIDDDGGRLTSVRVTDGFEWADDSQLHTPWRDTVIYEAHVKGQTMLHPDIPGELRGTYAGMAHPVMIEHLRALGVTAVQLLPVHYHLDEQHLQNLGLSNYWGYNTIGFFAPHTAYATRQAQEAGAKAVQDEFKGMVKLLHEAGLEVILDVVYNHTAEADQGGPAISFRGLGEERYYRHDEDGNYLDTTGCGNTLDFSEPRVVQLALDSLRYWVEEFHIDGFRFDLAVAMCRDGEHRFTPKHPFLVAAAADQTLHGIKLIAEPWDIGTDGWQTGNFPPGWADWNDRFRDTVRDFWVAGAGAIANGGHEGSLGSLATALAGSADVFASSGRSALASVNFVTAHDGFTLSDLVSYNYKHNEANGEYNRDGSDHNRSYNHGHEGQSLDDAILDRRALTSRNVMATLLLSLGVPMITAGDEIGRTQWGNNNAYCQDNELTWLDWNHDDRARRQLETTRTLTRLRRQFLAHQPHNYPSREDSSYLLWFNSAGRPMTVNEWADPANRVVQLLLGSPEGVLDGLMVINGGGAEARVDLPSGDALASLGLDGAGAQEYVLQFGTADDDGRGREATGGRSKGVESDVVPAFSIHVYRAR
ncbi:MAG TPA: glycogen debranching protein GlgX [Arthrobacter sp.]|nr:glycogen debranching protein GlgX [Arthrobacter sp.]